MGRQAGLAESRLTTDSIQRALRRSIEEFGEVGVQVAAYLRGRLIVNTWAGLVEQGTSREVGPHTVFPIFSVSKAVTAFAVHLQVERGLIDLDAPVAEYWPDYGKRGKEQLTVAHVLTHRAGVPQMPPGVTPELMSDWEWMTTRLTEVEPVHPPGTTNTYLSMTFGWLLGEVVRRTDPTRRPFAQFIHDEVAVPLNMSSFWFGVPSEESHRVATLSFPDEPPAPPEQSLAGRATPAEVALTPTAFNRKDVQRAVIPAVGGVSSASSLARLFAALAGGGALDGVRLLSESRVRSFLAPRPDMDKHDQTYGRPMPVGAGGFWVRIPGLLPADMAVIGQTGAGCSYGWGDPEAGLAVAICHNRMAVQPPFVPLADAIREHASELG